jgi:DNA-binding FadR family transcriptional regulator
MVNQPLDSEFVQYLAKQARQNPDNPDIPSLNHLSNILDTSVPRLREQLQVAKAMGLVEVRPRTGIKLQPYSFRFAVWKSLSYAINVDHSLFYKFAHLRVQLELAYWYEAVTALTMKDKEKLQKIIKRAEAKLKGSPIQIPHTEHRELHLSIYNKLDNPFVIGILEGFWDAYESVGLAVLNDLNYLEEVWDYHKKIVSSICKDDFESGFNALVEHIDLLVMRPDTSNNQGLDH